MGCQYLVDFSINRLYNTVDEVGKQPRSCSCLGTPIMRVAGLFAGIGGLEKGLSSAGHETVLLCENDDQANSVLDVRFPDVERQGDVCNLESIPSGIDVLAAGFPCQNLSLAGDKAGLSGDKSSVVWQLFRLIERERPPWVVLENVPFMLYLRRGEAVHAVTSELERLGYSWAYRIVDSRHFGIAQRRRRVYFVASIEGDPRDVLLADNVPPSPSSPPSPFAPTGFFWTEGRLGHGMTNDAVPPLKAGSSFGIPSPPAILLPSGRVVVPPIKAAESLQGFPVDWTSPADDKWRWRLVGNSVSPPVAEWIGTRLVEQQRRDTDDCDAPFIGERWPRAAWGSPGGLRSRCELSERPVDCEYHGLSEFDCESWPNLSTKALQGFVNRALDSSLRYPDWFLAGLTAALQSTASD